MRQICADFRTDGKNPLFPVLTVAVCPALPTHGATEYALRWLVLIVLLMGWLPGMRAQTAATGACGGVVYDPAGAAIPDAYVRLESDADGTVREAVTDRLGEFFLPDLPPGVYAVQFGSPGFDNLRVAALSVEVGRTLRLAPVLPVATQFQTVEVEEASERVSLDSPLDANLSPSELNALPLDGRRFQGLAVLTPLAAEDDAPPAADGESGVVDSDSVRLTIRGLHPQHNSYRLDGLSLTRAFDGEQRGGRTVPFTIPLEGVREFQVRVAGGSLGHDLGGSVNTVTLRGGDVVHGSLFGSLRDSGVGATNPFAVVTRYNNGSPASVLVKPSDTRTQFGGSVGGALPLVRRVFGFVAAEGQRRSFPGISAPSDPGFFSLSAEQVALLGNRGVGSAATKTALNFLDGLMGPVDRRADEFALFPRVDWQPSQRTHVGVGWVHLRFRSPSGQHSAPVEARGRASFGDTVTHADTVTVTSTTALLAKWILDLRGAYSRDAQFAVSPAPLATEPRTGPGGSAPEVSIASAFVFGNAAGLSTRRLPDERRTEGAIRLTYQGLAHTIHVGMDVSGVDERISAREGSSGAYDYTSGTTSGHDGGLVDFITDATYSATAYPNGGCPSVYAAAHYFCFQSFTQTFGAVPETRFHAVAWGMFVGDAWRLTPRLQVTSGVRYNFDLLPPAQHANNELDAVFGSVAATSNVPSDTNNVAPGAAIAWAVSQKTALRVGYGVHFGGVPGRTVQAALENTALPASLTTLRVTPRTIIDAACASAGTNFGYPATYTCSPFGAVQDTGATVFARGFQLPMAQVAELSVTQELSRHDSVSATYVMGLNRQLQNSTDLNIAPSTSRIAFRIVRNDASGSPTGEPGARGGDVFNVPLYTARKTAAFGPVTEILSNGNGTNHALAVQVEHRASHGLQARVAWTYSKSLDNVRSPGATPNENAQFDPFQPLYDRAPSNFDRRHRVSASAVWQPMLRHADLLERALANGWSVSPLLLFTSGRPYSYDIVGGTALAGGRERLNGSGGAAYLPSVGPNTQRLPWTQDVDLRVMRRFRLHDRLHLRATAEAFNLLNHVNVTAVQQRAFLPGTVGTDGITPLVFQDAATIAAEGLTTQAFGVATSSADAPTRERRLQFGVRLDW